MFFIRRKTNQNPKTSNCTSCVFIISFRFYNIIIAEYIYDYFEPFSASQNASYRGRRPQGLPGPPDPLCPELPHLQRILIPQRILLLLPYSEELQHHRKFKHDFYIIFHNIICISLSRVFCRLLFHQAILFLKMEKMLLFR